MSFISKIKTFFLEVFKEDPASSLKSAIKDSNIEKIKSLIAEGVNVNSRFLLDNSTPLHYAAQTNNVKCARILIEAGADVNAQEKYGRTPLHTAAVFGNCDVTKVLLENGADPNMLNQNANETPLSLTMGSKFYPDVADVLLNYGADINQGNKYGNTCLHSATFNGLEHIIKYLISKGAYINCQSNNGDTPLNVAIDEGHTLIARLIENHGGKTKQQSRYY